MRLMRHSVCLSTQLLTDWRTGIRRRHADFTERVSPRVFRVAALPAPSDREKTQMYVQRYIAHFPAGGELVIFDRSWYNRAGVEYVLGFCTPEQHRRFLDVCPLWERQVVDSGIRLLKYWLEVSPGSRSGVFGPASKIHCDSGS